jgi:hypothetical protein
MGTGQETKKDALNESGLCCGFSLRALGVVRSPDILWAYVIHLDAVTLGPQALNSYLVLRYSSNNPSGPLKMTM